MQDNSIMTYTATGTTPFTFIIRFVGLIFFIINNISSSAAFVFFQQHQQPQPTFLVSSSISLFSSSSSSSSSTRINMSSSSSPIVVVDIVTGASQGIGKAVADSIAHHRRKQKRFCGSTTIDVSMMSTSSSSIGNSSRSFDDNDNDSNGPADTSKCRYKLVLVGRNLERGQNAAAEISKSTGMCVVFEQCDVGNYNEVRALRQRILANSSVGVAQQQQEDDDTKNNANRNNNNNNCRIGILVNNAAEVPKKQKLVTRPRKISAAAEGGRSTSTITEEQQVDSQFATNVLGYHFMIKTFQDLMVFDSSYCSYVVNVASNWAGDLDLNDLQFKRRFYDIDHAYRQSKQCDRMLSVVWADKLKKKNDGSGDDGQGKAIVNACHPGDPCTFLSKSLGYNLWASPATRDFIDKQTPIPHLCGFVRGGGTTPTSSPSAKASPKSPSSYPSAAANSPSQKISVTGYWFDGSTKPHPHRFASLEQEANQLYDICESYCVEME